jgi:hypothetical protein
MRICHALDLTPEELAASAQVDYEEIAPLLDARIGLLVEQDRDDTWWKISEYVDSQLAMLLVVKMELTKALQNERARRAARIAQALERPKRSSPRR